MGHFTWIPKCLSFKAATLSLHKFRLIGSSGFFFPVVWCTVDVFWLLIKVNNKKKIRWCTIIKQKRHNVTLHVGFLTCCIQMTSCGLLTLFYLSAWSFTWMVFISVTKQRDTGYLSKSKGAKLRKYSSLFPTQLYRTNVANLPNCCNITLTVMASMESDVRKSRRHVGTDCLQRIKILEVIRPFVLLFCHAYCLVKNINSIR
jgi:hypothetical protein